LVALSALLSRCVNGESALLTPVTLFLAGFYTIYGMASGRVFARIDPKQFEASFLEWVQGISKTVKGVIAIDGKTLRRSHDEGAGKKPLHLVSAWALENRLVLAQIATEEKSNEITAIPKLLRQ
jgi:hypothetical protein